MKPLKVSEVNSFIKKLLYSNPLLGNISVQGEIEDIRASKSDIRFFTLTGDNEEILRCICFDKDLEIEEGKESVVTGRIDIYPRNSVYQIVVKKVVSIKDGKGYTDLEKLKEKLYKKGYFDPDKKKPIPKFPKKIGVITSLRSAAVKDILNVLNNRKLGLEINIFDSGVQGIKSAERIVDGIKYFNKKKDVDLILISRGGGSKLDLEVFNREYIADSIFRSEKPVICGIGHEIDTSIADLTADVYSTTPTGAAKLIIENYTLYEEKLENYRNKIIQIIDNLIQHNYNYVNINKSKILLLNPQNKLTKKLNKIENYKNIINTNILEKINISYKKIDEHKYFLSRYDYNNIFNRGFVFIKDENNNIIDSVDNIDFSLTYTTVFKDCERKIKFIKEEE